MKSVQPDARNVESLHVESQQHENKKNDLSISLPRVSSKPRTLKKS